MTQDGALTVDGIPLLSTGQGQSLSYAFPEGAALPGVLMDFLLGKEVDAVALAEVLDGEARTAAGDSDEALELLLLARLRLNAHPRLDDSRPT
jgi:hypothetical protein